MQEVLNRFSRKSAVLVDNFLDKISLVEKFSQRAYRNSIRNHKFRIPELPSADLDIVKSLEREGAFMTSLDELEIQGTAKMLSSARNLMPKLLGEQTQAQQYYIHATPPQIKDNPEIFLWGLNERLLKISENYIRLPISYQGSFVSRNIADGREVGSRLWHMDLEDYRGFKIIVYLHDVFEDGGPFQYVPRQFTADISHTLKQHYGYGKTKRFRAAIMEEIIPQSEWKPCPGPAGTVVIADTSNVFHRGMIPEVADRFAIFFEYLSQRPKRPHYCKQLFSQEDLGQVTQGLTPYQIECASASQFSALTRLPKQGS